MAMYIKKAEIEAMVKVFKSHYTGRPSDRTENVLTTDTVLQLCNLGRFTTTQDEYIMHAALESLGYVPLVHRGTKFQRINKSWKLDMSKFRYQSWFDDKLWLSNQQFYGGDTFKTK